MGLDALTTAALVGEVGAIVLVSWYLRKHWKIINDEEFGRVRDELQAQRKSQKGGKRSSKAKVRAGEIPNLQVLLSIIKQVVGLKTGE